MYHILLVDDEPSIRKGLRKIIDWEGLGFTISGEARNGREACRIIRSSRPDVIITDIKMPQMDGLDLIKEVRQKGLETPFIIISGYDEFEYARTAMRFKVRNYLLKPIEEEELIACLREVKEELLTRQARGRNGAAGNGLRRIVEEKATAEEIDALRAALNLKGPLYYAILEVDEFNRLEQPPDEQNRSLIIDAVEEALGAVVKKEAKPGLLKEGPGIYGLLVHPGIYRPFSNRLRKFVSLLHSQVSGNGAWDLSIFIGRGVDTLDNLPLSYRTASLAREHRFYRDYSSVIYYQDVKDLRFRDDYIPLQEWDHLVEQIARYDREAMAKSCLAIAGRFEEEYLSPQVVTIQINYFLSKIMEVIAQFSAPIAPPLDDASFLNRPYIKITLGDLFHQVRRFCLVVAESMRSLSRRGGIARSVEEYINNHFNTELTLRKAAERLHVNTAYLGQLFKRHTGLTFSRYLHRRRVEEAKRLLRETDLKVYEIAYKVGYQDPNYFITKFERLVCQTPGHYRKEQGIKGLN